MPPSKRLNFPRPPSTWFTLRRFPLDPGRGEVRQVPCTPEAVRTFGDHPPSPRFRRGLGPDVSARVSLDLALIGGAPCSSYTHQGQIALLRTTVAGNVGSRPLDPQRQDTKSLGLNFPPPCWKRRPRRLQRAPQLPLAFASSPRTRRTSHFSRCFPWSSSRRAPSVAQIPRYALFQLLAPPLDSRAREILVAVIHGLELAAIDRNACFR